MPWARRAMASIPVVLPEFRRRGRLPAGGRAASVAGCAVAASCLAPVPLLLPTDIPAGVQQAQTNICKIDITGVSPGESLHCVLPMRGSRASHTGVTQLQAEWMFNYNRERFTFWLKGVGHLPEVELAFCYGSQQSISAIWRLLAHDGGVGGDLSGRRCGGTGGWGTKA